MLVLAMEFSRVFRRGKSRSLKAEQEQSDIFCRAQRRDT
jgi:hypothetical protein